MSWRCWPGIVALVAFAGCSGSSEDSAATTAASAASVTTPTTRSTATPTTPTTSGVGSPTPAPRAPSMVDVTAAAPTAAPQPPSPPTTGVAPVGFDRVVGRVTADDGSTCDVCLWSAATPQARARGLMGVTDLAGADGMVFVWESPNTGAFWMRDTPQPLSIAFFGADGAFVSATDMVPCLAPTPDAECARYAAAGPYTLAVEVAAGGLPALLIGPGSRLDLTDQPCEERLVPSG